MCAALMQIEPAVLNGVFDPGTELWPTGLERVEERRVDLLDVDAAVLNRLDARGELDQLAGLGLRVGKGRSAEKLVMRREV